MPRATSASWRGSARSGSRASRRSRRCATWSGSAAAAPDADNGGAFERLQALARADARSVFDEARRLGLLEVLQGMPASERKYCAKVPLTELSAWVDRLHRNATLRAARTVR